MTRDLSKLLPRPHERGFSLIELMIALVLGLIILGAVIAVFLSTQQTNRLQETLSRTQENGRFIYASMAQDLRGAGYRPCEGGQARNLLNTGGAGFSMIEPMLNQSVIAPPTPPVTNVGDIVTLVTQEEVGRLIGSGGTQPAVQGTTGVLTVTQGDIVTLASDDGRTCETFQNVAAAPGVLNRGPGQNVSPGNMGPAAAVDYAAFDGPTRIMRATPVSYFVGPAPDGSGQQSLYRFVQRNPADSDNTLLREVARGLVEMRIAYGRDTSGNRRIDNYTWSGDTSTWGPAAWEQVAAVQVHLLLASQENNVLENPAMTFPFADGVFQPTDRRHYVSQTFTFSLRNRLD